MQVAMFQVLFEKNIMAGSQDCVYKYVCVATYTFLNICMHGQINFRHFVCTPLKFIRIIMYMYMIYIPLSFAALPFH